MSFGQDIATVRGRQRERSAKSRIEALLRGGTMFLGLTCSGVIETLTQMMSWVESHRLLIL